MTTTNGKATNGSMLDNNYMVGGLIPHPVGALPATEKKEQTPAQILIARGPLFSDEAPRRLESSLMAYMFYRQMRLDPTLALARTLAIAPLVSAGWTVEVKNDAPDGAKEFIEDEMEKHRVALTTHMLGGFIDYGWAPFELVPIVDEKGFNRFSKIKPLLQLWTTILVDPRNGALRGVRQNIQQQVDLNLSESMVLTMDQEGTDFYGRGAMEIARLPYDHWLRTEESAERHCAKVAGAHWVIYYPTGFSIINGVSTDNYDVANAMLSSLKASGAMIVPSSVSAFMDDLNAAATSKTAMAWKIELITAQGSAEAEYVDRQKYLDALKVRAIGVPERSILEGQFGTKAEAESHGDMGLIGLEYRYSVGVGQINKQAVNLLLEDNYGEESIDTVFLKPAPIADVDKAFLQKILEQLLVGQDTAMLESAEIDSSALKQRLGVPVREEKDEEKEKEELQKQVDANKPSFGKPQPGDKPPFKDQPEPVNDGNAKSLSLFDIILSNPNHDERGRFASGQGSGVSGRAWKQNKGYSIIDNFSTSTVETSNQHLNHQRAEFTTDKFYGGAKDNPTSIPVITNPTRDDIQGMMNKQLRARPGHGTAIRFAVDDGKNVHVWDAGQATHHDFNRAICSNHFDWISGKSYGGTIQTNGEPDKFVAIAYNGKKDAKMPELSKIFSDAGDDVHSSQALVDFDKRPSKERGEWPAWKGIESINQNLTKSQEIHKEALSSMLDEPAKLGNGATNGIDLTFRAIAPTQVQHDAIHSVLDRMTGEAIDRAQRNLGGVYWHPSMDEFHSYYAGVYGRNNTFTQTEAVKASTAWGNPNSGLFSDMRARLHLDHDGHEKETYSHEMGHVVDGSKHELSGTRDWIDIWNDEIISSSVEPKLSEYARTSQQEGFAEMYRAVLSDPSKAKRALPKAYKYFQKLGLAPKVR